MQITDLPEEVLAYIIKKLDLKSVYNLYNTCTYLKSIICMYNVVKTANLALSTMATMRFFKHCFMKDISRHIHNLDLRGVGDLNKTSLLLAVGRMKCLKTLDVSYTNITLFDLFKVYEICPTIKNIGCNFVFGKKKDVNLNNMPNYQNLFQNFDKIHLVGNSGNLFYSNLAVWMLHKAHLSEVQLTIVENCSTLYGQLPMMNVLDKIDINVNFKFISIYILNLWKIPNTTYGTIFSLPSLLQKKEKYECVAIIETNCNKSQVYVSPIFKNSCECYNAKDIDDIDVYKHIINGVIMLWGKAENVFDDLFFQKLKRKLDNFFPYHIEDDSTVAPEKVDKFFLSIPSHETKSNVSSVMSNFKKKRLAPQTFNLDYDTVFSNHTKVHFTLFFPSNTSCPPITLSPNSQYLKKLGSLSLTGFVQYSRVFFNVLFRCCEQLETLNVECSPNTYIVARNIHLSRSLKNLRLVDREINFDKLFLSLSQCSTLENIHIVDLSQNNNDLGDPSSLFEKCTNLYCICIFASMSTATKTRRNQLFKNLINKYGKWYMRMELCTKLSNTMYNYDPYVDVFNVNPIKPLEQLY